MNYKLLLTLMLLVPAAALAEAGETAMAQTHEEQIRDWRQTRDERLASDSGWMTLVGLEWLQEGENLIGSSRGIQHHQNPGRAGTLGDDPSRRRRVAVYSCAG
jgi:uncharacterized protein (DUF1684 family)